MTPGKMRFDLTGECALVTGASSGLGWHFALVLANAGAKVAVAARRIGKLEELAAKIRVLGGEAIPVTMDVGIPAVVTRGFDEVETRLGPVTILVNSAGTAVTKPIQDHEEKDWDLVMNTNLKGAWLVSCEASRRMVARGLGGSIINISSILGIRVTGHLPSYCASKAGLNHLTKAMAMELARYGIRVNALAPGYVETELNRDFFASKAGQSVVRRIPQRRLARMEDLAGPILLLASKASSYMTGTTLVVDGGHLVSSL